MSSESGGAVEPLACPTCARRFGLDERFCPDCEMPLVYVGRADMEPITAAHEKARKVRPEYATGELVKAAFAQNLAEAQLIQGILLEQGIPSVERRSRGFDVPDFLAAGPRDILVPRSGYEDARELLTGTAEHEHEHEPRDADERPLRLALWVLVALVAAVAIVWLLYQAAT